jgi:hypothetical protein
MIFNFSFRAKYKDVLALVFVRSSNPVDDDLDAKLDAEVCRVISSLFPEEYINIDDLEVRYKPNISLARRTKEKHFVKEFRNTLN